MPWLSPRCKWLALLGCHNQHSSSRHDRSWLDFTSLHKKVSSTKAVRSTRTDTYAPTSCRRKSERRRRGGCVGSTFMFSLQCSQTAAQVFHGHLNRSCTSRFVSGPLPPGWCTTQVCQSCSIVAWEANVHVPLSNVRGWRNGFDFLIRFQATGSSSNQLATLYKASLMCAIQSYNILASFQAFAMALEASILPFCNAWQMPIKTEKLPSREEGYSSPLSEEVIGVRVENGQRSIVPVLPYY